MDTLSSLLFFQPSLATLPQLVINYSLSSVGLFGTPETVAHQAPLSKQFSWNALPLPSPVDLPDPGIEPGSPELQVDSLSSEPPGKPQITAYFILSIVQQCLPQEVLRNTLVSSKFLKLLLGEIFTHS